jgi:hypothetical protein
MMSRLENLLTNSTCATKARWERAAQVHLSYYMRLKRFEKGAEIVRQGEKSKGVFLIKQGSCRVLMAPPPGTAAAARGTNRFARGSGAAHTRMLEAGAYTRPLFSST